MDYALPDWLLKVAEEPKEPYLLWSDTKNFILSKQGKHDELSSNLLKLYEKARDSSIGVKVDPSVYSDKQPKLKNFNDKDFLRRLEGRFEKYLATYYSYEVEPHDFYNSYNFVSHHITLWQVDNVKLPLFKQEWKTHDLLEHQSIKVKKIDHRLEYSLKLKRLLAPKEIAREYVESKVTIYEENYEDLIIAAADYLYSDFYALGYRKHEIEEDFAAKSLSTLQKRSIAKRNSAMFFDRIP